MIKDALSITGGDTFDKILVLLATVGIVTGFLAAGWLIIRGVGALARRILRRQKTDEALYPFIIRSIKVVLWIIWVFILLKWLGVQTSVFFAILGAVGAGVAFSMKETLGNFIGGVLILLNKPFHRGDHVESVDAEGLVVNIDLMYTTLKTFDNKVVIVPNGILANQTVINFTRESRRRIDADFSILPKDAGDLARAKDILLSLCRADERISEEPEPVVVVTGQSEGYLLLQMRAWCSTSDYWTVKYEMEEKAVVAFRDNDIDQPRPVAEALARDA